MKQITATIALAAALMGSAAIARADDPFVAVGFVSKANPASKVLQGFTEGSNPCGASHPVFGNTSGVDGSWITLPEGAPGRSALLRTDALDADVWFYRSVDGACVLIEANDDPGWHAMATDLTGAEDGIVPAGATYAIVNVAAGDGVSFTFMIE